MNDHFSLSSRSSPHDALKEAHRTLGPPTLVLLTGAAIAVALVLPSTITLWPVVGLVVLFDKILFSSDRARRDQRGREER